MRTPHLSRPHPAVHIVVAVIGVTILNQLFRMLQNYTTVVKDGTPIDDGQRRIESRHAGIYAIGPGR
ncbi:MAG: hypothetical protein R3E01_00220 [Pirellulaceae bacterium]|nr:hypothetical protein [Planctomycetales bacterium]